MTNTTFDKTEKTKQLLEVAVERDKQIKTYAGQVKELYLPSVSPTKQGELEKMMAKEKTPIRERAANYNNYLGFVRD